MTREKTEIFARASFILGGIFGLLEVFCVGFTTDTNGFVHCALRLWRFGTSEFYSRCIDQNAPLHVLLYAPLTAFAAATSLPPPPVLHGTAFLLCLLSLCTLSRVLKIHAIDKRERNMWLGTSALVLLVMPSICGVFADREHLLFVLTLPWILQMLLGKQPLLPTSALAAIGFCMKPLDLVLFAGMTLFSGPPQWSLRQRLFSPSSWIIGLSMLVYLCGVYLFFPKYFSEILPMAAVIYPTIHMPLSYKYRFGGILLLPALVLVFEGVKPWRQQIGWIGFTGACIALFFLNAGYIYTAYLLIVPLAFACAAPWIGRYREHILPTRRMTTTVLAACAAFFLLALSAVSMTADVIAWRRDGYSQFFYRADSRLNAELKREAGEKFILLSSILCSSNIERFGGTPESVFGFENINILPWLYHHGKDPYFPRFSRFVYDTLLRAVERNPSATLIVDTSPLVLPNPPEGMDILAFFKRDPQVRTALADYHLVNTLDYCSFREKHKCRYTIWRRQK